MKWINSLLAVHLPFIMTDSRQGKISVKQAIYLALTVLCIYYPITIYVNIPREHWRNVQFLAFPAIVNFIFYV
ncbi:MAG: hypothetical protein C0490_17515, partial [Marivirga sp.]|nr:hypothetical protein [Marivirga sp.]